MFNINTLSTSLLKFDPHKVIPFNEDVYDILPSEWSRRFMALPPAGSYIVSSDAHRPDLVSYKIYGSVQYKLLLMMYNLILSITKFKAGIRIVYPALVNMEAAYMSLPSEKAESTKWTTTPVNEAEALRLALLHGKVAEARGVPSPSIQTNLRTLV